MNRSSRLEIFPDELFLDLFSYIPPIELYHVWCGLNSRLNSILRSVRISFDLIENTLANTRSLNYFSQQIIYIHIQVPYKSLDLSQFSNLRSLVVDTQLTHEQLDAIRPTILPHLERLNFSEWWDDKVPLNDVIFNRYSSSEQNIPWIKVCRLPSVPKYFLCNTQNLSYIHTMIFNRIHPSDMNTILSLPSLLRRLKVTLVRWMPDTSLSKTTLPENYQHKHLIHLHVTMDTCNKLDDLYPLLSHLPCLRYLYIACDSLTLYDFEKLALELSTRVPWLQRFSCSFKQTYIKDIKQLHRMNPLFRHMRCKKVEWSGGWHYYCVTTENI